ncbi:uncharacterized protein L201_007924 [Kwoniella dendrophila CBS 6074]|uniref:F-box domain-containing protein n=1 Tax=Kwoniella dendrophila CBS 6074 TaxID=1295534 RepID=A0AAX4K5Q3_9TREE
MPKRARSNSPISDLHEGNIGSSSSKRFFGNQNEHIHIIQHGKGRGISDLFPFQEIFLRILSFLPPNDLAKVQGVNRYWSKMSVDPQLWKRLYLSRYPHPHHSRLIYNTFTSSGTLDQHIDGSQSPRTPRSLRPIARLPSRAFPPPSPKRSPSLAEGQITPSLNASGRGLVITTGSLGLATPLPSRNDSELNKGNQKRKEEQDELGHGVRNDGVDWKLMLRLVTNWSNGNALSQSTIPLPPSPSPSLQSDTASSIPPLTLPFSSTYHHSHNRSSGKSEQYIALSPSYIFIASPLSPLVQVHSSSTTSAKGTPLGIIPPPPGWSNPKRPDNVTCVVSDQSVIQSEEDIVDVAIPARITVFYQSGGFVVLSISQNSTGIGVSWKREFINQPNSNSRSMRRRRITHHELVEGDPVVLATLHWPVLVSCTRDFNLSVYSLASTSLCNSETNQTPKPKHLQTLRSEVSFHPANLTLFPASLSDNDSTTEYDKLEKHSIQAEKNESEHFKVAFTYCTPLYPSSWTVAVQEFSINLATSSDVDTVKRGESFHVGRNNQYEGEGEENEFIWPRKIRPIIGVKDKAIGIGSDGRWCILVGAKENKIQVFALPHSHSDRTDYAATAKKVKRNSSITHSQTLTSTHSSSSEITSLALNSGRCVSGNRDGRILVWELDDSLEQDGTTQEGGEGRIGRTIGYVEVKQGGRKQSIWRGPTGPQHTEELLESDEETNELNGTNNKIMNLPHPQSISSAARSLFLPRPPMDLDNEIVNQNEPPIRYLTFDEEKIVGIVRTRDNRDERMGSDEEVMKIWSFS